ncbi:MAG TPA: L,D-transpeptidase [Pyrinomonadaceae bacterium]|nr:L,D-transpeptidase [Pyrinomonadaceae bacterium]
MYRTRTGLYHERFELSYLTRGLILVGFVFVLLFYIGCVPNQQSGNNPPPTNANTDVVANSNANAAANTSNESAASRIPITLPVVDALLSDEDFLSEVRRSVQPTDEQLDKLRNMARDSVLQLDENEIEDANRSTRGSLANADKKIKEILGKDSGDRFLQLAREYWSRGEQEVSLKPNQVPTDTRLVINAPAYRMDLFQEGKLIKSYKIGIGYPEFPLPVGVRTAKEIIFNPVWTPPDEPWVKGEFAPGKKVEAGDKKNPLGVLKIPIGLPSLIHGGKNPARLGTFASHGCVGLTNQLVQEFAVHLASLSGTSLTTEQIKGYEKNRKETSEVDLSKPVPVELRYETILVDDGKIHIYRDVYERGTNTEENLNRVLEVYGISLNDLTPEEQTKVRDALKKMAIDAHGKPVEEGGEDKKPSTSDKVTKTMKGEKEIVIDIAALKGKGYPLPANINS